MSFLIAFMAAAPFMSAATKLFSVLAAAGIFIFTLPFIKRDNTFGYRVAVMLTTLILLFASVVRTYAYYDLSKYDAERIYGVSADAEIEITETVYSDNYITLLAGKLKSFNGEKFDLKVYLECEYMTDYDIGDTVLFSVTAFEPNVILEDGYMTHTDLLSAGYSVCCISSEDSARLVEKGHGLRYSLEKINVSLSAKFISLLGDDSGALSSALALGNDSRADESIIRDFRRSGLSHILVLSGSHIVLIIGTAEVLLRKYLKARKKIRYPVLLVLLPLYILIVMSPVPVIRAGLMYAIFCIIEIFNRKSDSMTNLFVSAFVMIFADPCLAFSMSLWMSFLATLALIAFLPIVNKILYIVKNKNKGKLLVSFSLSVTVSALIALIGLLSNVVFMPAFGTFSTVSVITNVVFGPLLTAYLVGSMILILTFPIPALARIVAFPLSKFGELLLLGINRASAYKYSVISLETGMAKEICILFFVIAVIYLIVKVKRKSIIFIPVTALYVLLAINTFYFSQGLGAVQILDIKDSLDESFVVSYGDNFSIIDVSDGRFGNFTSAAKEAKSRGSCEFDSVVLTHYHRYHISSIKRFITRETVRNVLLPIPNNDYDTEIYEKIIEILDSFDIPYIIYSDDVFSEIADNVYIKAFPIERIKRSTHALISFSLFYEDRVFTYAGSSVNDGSIYGKVDERIKISDTVILGRHGPIQKTVPVYSLSPETDIFINDELISEKFFASGENAQVNVDTDGMIEFEMKSE